MNLDSPTMESIVERVAAHWSTLTMDDFISVLHLVLLIAWIFASNRKGTHNHNRS